MKFSEHFAQAVEQHRTAEKLSRQALAAKAGLHQTYIGLIERGRSNPSLDAANAIAEALGMPLSKLVMDAESLRNKGQSAK
ncbi:MAG TPA: helix-turn-helix transcriptional regulator [Methylomirabilota bacterium]|nr:helix-turn-helix transcriptional regulator [Methylomirabilota bacterium]